MLENHEGPSSVDGDDVSYDVSLAEEHARQLSNRLHRVLLSVEARDSDSPALTRIVRGCREITGALDLVTQDLNDVADEIELIGEEATCPDAQPRVDMRAVYERARARLILLERLIARDRGESPFTVIDSDDEEGLLAETEPPPPRPRLRLVPAKGTFDVSMIDDLEAAEEHARQLEDRLDRVMLAVRRRGCVAGVADRLKVGAYQILPMLRLAAEHLDEQLALVEEA